MVRVSREAKEEEDKSGMREVEGERERVEAHSKRVCLDHSPSPNSCGFCFELNSDSELENVGKCL